MSNGGSPFLPLTPLLGLHDFPSPPFRCVCLLPILHSITCTVIYKHTCAYMDTYVHTWTHIHTRTLNTSNTRCIHSRKKHCPYTVRTLTPPPYHRFHTSCGSPVFSFSFPFILGPRHPVPTSLRSLPATVYNRPAPFNLYRSYSESSSVVTVYVVSLNVLTLYRTSNGEPSSNTGNCRTKDTPD